MCPLPNRLFCALIPSCIKQATELIGSPSQNLMWSRNLWILLILHTICYAMRGSFSSQIQLFSRRTCQILSIAHLFVCRKCFADKLQLRSLCCILDTLHGPFSLSFIAVLLPLNAIIIVISNSVIMLSNKSGQTASANDWKRITYFQCYVFVCWFIWDLLGMIYLFLLDSRIQAIYVAVWALIAF